MEWQEGKKGNNNFLSTSHLFFSLSFTKRQQTSFCQKNSLVFSFARIVLLAKWPLLEKRGKRRVPETFFRLFLFLLSCTFQQRR